MIKVCKVFVCVRVISQEPLVLFAVITVAASKCCSRGSFGCAGKVFVYDVLSPHQLLLPVGIESDRPHRLMYIVHTTLHSLDVHLFYSMFLFLHKKTIESIARLYSHANNRSHLFNVVFTLPFSMLAEYNNKAKCTHKRIAFFATLKNGSA